MKRNFLCYISLSAVMAGVASSGCATKALPVGAAGAGPRPHGKELTTHRPKPDSTKAPAPPSVIEEPTGALTLQQALALVLARSPELSAYAWEIRAQEAAALQAGLRPNPEAGVVVEDMAGTGAFSGVRQAQTTLQLSQLVEFGGKRAARVKAVGLGREMARQDYELKRLAMLGRTHAAFLEVLSGQEKFTVLEATLALAEKVRATVAEKVAAGKVSPVEEVKARAAVAEVKIAVDVAGQDLNTAHRRLSGLWGNSQPRFQRVEGKLEEQPPVPTFDQLATRLDQSPELAKSRVDILQRDAVLELERKKRTPDVTFSGGYRHLNDTKDHALVVGASVPLPFFNRNQGGIREAEARLAKAHDEQRASVLRLRDALAEAHQQLTRADMEARGLRTKVLPAVQQVFDATMEGYQGGKFSYLEALDAQRTLIQNRLQYLEALSRFHQAVAVLERLLGGPLSVNEKHP